MLDPLNAGPVTNMARPGGHLTRITLDAGIEIWGKRLEMLKEAVPSTINVAFLGMRDGWDGSSGQFLRDASSRLGISLISMVPNTGTTSEIERVFTEMMVKKPDAVLVSGEGDLYAHRKLIVELAERNRLPMMCPYRDYLDAGGLMAYTRSRAVVGPKAHHMLVSRRASEKSSSVRPKSTVRPDRAATALVIRGPV
jgi:ABC-type uncharacterized transport system substrate-binding protein